MQQNAACALWKLAVPQAAQRAFYEKNAIFSAWLMRRIGASGSLAAMTGFRSMPLAMRLEPSDISTTGAGGGGGA